ncbi:hypothetical protein AWM70_08160 [Paenibacillus yonginensis]|uniref:Uncharacterized protein n=1 Tax=Paenibacillus yonginensis TaxID=1462996 RepID=A0A1B1MZG2_9BACL|nr:hypothetical protein AWM70_08160 [Paenibacillus yonginensis]
MSIQVLMLSKVQGDRKGGGFLFCYRAGDHEKQKHRDLVVGFRCSVVGSKLHQVNSAIRF